jgi:aspartyl-tRNA(Asn)/glutamyl-tRNA(Gln) amidotransferase subunit C
MALTIKEIDDIAMLARLNLKADEKKDLAQQLSLILDYTHRLQDINTDNIEPLVYILPGYNTFREDIVHPSTPRDEMLANGPLLEDGQYKVPKIL